MDIYKSEVNFTFELTDIKEFLDRPNENWGSPFFYCRSMPFYVNLKYAQDHRNSALTAGLVLYDPLDIYTYNMSVSYELRLINWLEKSYLVHDYVRKYEEFFTSKDKEIGHYFYPISDLYYSPYGWVRDNKIRLNITLNCGNFYKTSPAK